MGLFTTYPNVTFWVDKYQIFNMKNDLRDECHSAYLALGFIAKVIWLMSDHNKVEMARISSIIDCCAAESDLVEDLSLELEPMKKIKLKGDYSTVLISKIPLIPDCSIVNSAFIFYHNIYKTTINKEIQVIMQKTLIDLKGQMASIETSLNGYKDCVTFLTKSFYAHVYETGDKN